MGGGELEPTVFELLSRLEKKMSHAIKSVGNIEHEVYPQMNNYCIVLLYGYSLVPMQGPSLGNRPGAHRLCSV